MTTSPPLSPSASLRLPIVERFLAEVHPVSVLEVGCGMGAMAYRLASQYDYRGYEPDSISFEAAAERIAALGRGEVRNGPLPDEPDRVFDLLCAFEVLEHLEDDRGALESWTRWVRPGGAVMVSVPAHPERFGPSDLAVGHIRRYTLEGLETLMRSCGLGDVEVRTWGMPAGYLLDFARNRLVRRRGAGRSLEDRTAGSGRMLQPPPWTGRAVELSMIPFAVLQRPFETSHTGVGFVALGRRAG
jgi:SAM-dependent methyltransferase